MKRINKREVELTPAEMCIVAAFEEGLSSGATIQEAAKVAIHEYCTEGEEGQAFMRSGLTDRFVQYVSDGTLRWRPEGLTLIEVG